VAAQSATDGVFPLVSNVAELSELDLLHAYKPSFREYGLHYLLISLRPRVSGRSWWREGGSA
jgi:hypothetical protein